MKHTVLCIDDEKDNVEALERLFRKKYRVLTATSGPEAISLLAENDVTVIISDQRMPDMTGVELLTESLKTHPDAIRILLTGYTDIDSVIAAINSGQIYRYVTKPWDSVDLENAVRRAVERYELHRTIAEQNDQLKVANAELRTLDEAKSHFMYLVNHELKTPLTSLLSFAELLNETKLDEDQKLYLSKVIKSAERLKDLIFDVLLITSSETGQKRLHRKKTDLKSFLKSQLDKHHSALKEKDLKVTLEVPKVSLDLDPDVMGEVVTRLLGNAMKFAPEGETLKFFVEDTDSKKIRLVLDNPSPPIKKEALARLQRPFHLEEDFMNHSKGTGLGLAVVQSLTKLHSVALELDYKDGHFQARLTL